MQETRRARLQSVIQDELSHVIARELKDPRIPDLTITKVEVSPDAGMATVYVALLGGNRMTPDGRELSEAEAKQRIQGCLEGLASASGFLRRHLGGVLTVRHVPALAFREDRGFENVSRVHELLREISTQDSGSAPTPAASGDPDKKA
jgi:ribosome-binding factor A